MIRMLLFHIHAPFLVISLQLWDLSVCCFLPFLMLKELYFGIIYFSLELCLDSCVNLLLPFPCLYLLNESLSMGSKSVIRESLYDMAPATSPPSVLPTLTSHSLPHMICSHFLAQSLFPFPPLLCKCCCFFLEYQQSSSPSSVKQPLSQWWRISSSIYPSNKHFMIPMGLCLELLP